MNEVEQSVDDDLTRPQSSLLLEDARDQFIPVRMKVIPVICKHLSVSVSTYYSPNGRHGNKGPPCSFPGSSQKGFGKFLGIL